MAYNFLKRAYSYFSKKFVILLSKIVNVSKSEYLYMCSPCGIEFVFLSIPSFIKEHLEFVSGFPTDFPLPGWVKTCNEVKTK
jgi:hypothetical protein